MHASIRARAILLGLALLTVSCGSSPTAPAPPVIVQAAGVWRGTATTTAVTGGECFAPTFQALIGTAGPISIAVTQSGATLNATLTNIALGATCVYTGTAGASAVTLAWTSCSASNAIGAQCPSGLKRDILLQTNSINATISGTSFTGTSAELYNVVNSGTTTGVGTLNIQSSFALTRQ